MGIVEQVLIEASSGSIPKLLRFLVEAPLGESVGAFESVIVFPFVGCEREREQVKKHFVDAGPTA
jgi:hypothetical protein